MDQEVLSLLLDLAAVFDGTAGSSMVLQEALGSEGPDDQTNDVMLCRSRTSRSSEAVTDGSTITKSGAKNAGKDAVYLIHRIVKRTQPHLYAAK